MTSRRSPVSRPVSPHSLRAWLPRVAMMLAAGPLCVLAESGIPDGRPHGPPDFVRKADVDGDGALSVAEAGSLRGPIKDHFNEIDTDHDGRVTWAEIDVWMKAHPPARRMGDGGPDGPPGGGPPASNLPS